MRVSSATPLFDGWPSAVISASSPVARLNVLVMGVFVLDVIPEAIDLALRELRVRDDVVECDDAAVCDERPVHLEVFRDSLVAVVAVDEEEVDAPAREDAEYSLSGRLVVRVATQEVE